MTKNEVAQVRNTLKKAKEVLVKNKWTRDTLAKKANGQTECDVTDPQAKCFCALGAIGKALNLSESRTLPLEDLTVDVLKGAIEKSTNLSFSSYCLNMTETNSHEFVAHFNDEVAVSKKDVLKVFDFAIANVKSLLQ